MKNDYETISPVEKIGKLYFKREDLFVNEYGLKGTKMRQAHYLINDYKKNNINQIVSYCSIHSPQSAIIASVCNELNMKCIICFGGTTDKKILYSHYPHMVKKLNQTTKIICKTGRHNVLKQKVLQSFNSKDYGIIYYGMSVPEKNQDMIKELSIQVKNIPDDLDNLVITCGSGISSSILLYGIKKYNKKIKNIYLVHTAPNRLEQIKQNIGFMPDNVKSIMLFDRKGFTYEKGIYAEYNGIVFHPMYEAKTFHWLMKESNIDFDKEKTLFWLVG